MADWYDPLLFTWFDQFFMINLNQYSYYTLNPIHGGGEGQFETTFSDIFRTFKWVHAQFWKFLTFPKNQKQKIWNKSNYDFFATTPLGGGI